jgi:hypothetical protein
MSAWLLRNASKPHHNMSLGAPNRRLAIPQADGTSHRKVDTMNIFYIIGVVVVIVIVAGVLGLRV